ncbi:hypothetical protein [Halorhabdus amylolytica]|uniref:hypothetical protein n=1 Tax=Halorhabdus amylolytica TaxID=2559573 RepID=UPI0010A9B019|nr:hypothetical protein [Halorhabdus amylolytica]
MRPPERVELRDRRAIGEPTRLDPAGWGHADVLDNRVRVRQRLEPTHVEVRGVLLAHAPGRQYLVLWLAWLAQGGVSGDERRIVEGVFDSPGRPLSHGDDERRVLVLAGDQSH